MNFTPSPWFRVVGLLAAFATLAGCVKAFLGFKWNTAPILPVIVISLVTPIAAGVIGCVAIDAIRNALPKRPSPRGFDVIPLDKSKDSR
ncbi:MAG: hypothetical protein ABSF29_12515 [Tepidisphaeraceae bacterium]